MTQYRMTNEWNMAYDMMSEAQKTDFWVQRYTEDQAGNYLNPLDKAIEVDYIIVNEPLKLFAQTYFAVSCKEIYKNRISEKAVDG
ncbi:hypothetical protein BU25DRAFT_58036 [Macroventuria anomochaeta]|uniref:Uncharacterized protein n=1 Tax=Macroventuria anomochaeta TaxID=301207 RepID=A0ACB6S129_9PLEO|nr:uncharacterized protein BU25DRAFT_58036 [Macroventuria anomochaeta]KAF2627677.1 hypothetical protein BU25DRAFT_58036 [Macroventuria anomochaeta]